MLPGRLLAFSSHVDLVNTSDRSQLPIIQVSRDAELSRLREKVLVAAGHSVRSLTPEESIEESHLPGANRVWIFCHTVEPYQTIVIAASLRRVKPGDRLIRMTGLEEVTHADRLFDESLDPTIGVDGLLRAVAQLSTLSD